jgi:hypothetical protein
VNFCIDYQLLNSVKLELTCDFATSTLTVDDNIDADANYCNVLFNNPVKYCDTNSLNKVSQVGDGNSTFPNAFECKKPFKEYRSINN